MKKRDRWVRAITIAIFILLLGGWDNLALSQPKYPTRAIDLIAPFAPGGVTDLVARVMAPNLSAEWKVPVNVINKPGGNTIPANLAVMQSPPDGYTLLVDNQTAFMLPVIVKDLPFDLMNRTFLPTIADTPFILIVPSSSPHHKLTDLIAAVKKDPESFTWTSLGGVAIQDYFSRQFFEAIGVDISKTRRVMAQGGAPAVALTAGGHVHCIGISFFSIGVPEGQPDAKNSLF
jgi:tripartite-type tricarboxylate transporter receptor subunit TctC